MATTHALFIAKPVKCLVDELFLTPILSDLSNLVALPRNYFGYFYLRPCLRLIQYLQHLPPADENNVDHPELWIPEIQLRLQKIIIGMKVYEGLLTHKNIENNGSQRDLERYQLFFCLFMYGLGPVLTGRKIIIHASHTKTAVWNPLLRAMPKHHRYQFQVSSSCHQQSTPAFIHIFFDPKSLHWLFSQDMDMYSIITHPQHNASPLENILCQTYHQNNKRIDGGVTNNGDNIIDLQRIPTSMPSSKEDFFRWLVSVIKKQEIKCDTKGALLFRYKHYYALPTPKIFEFYSQKVKKDWQNIQKQFLSLNKHVVNKDNQPPLAIHSIETHGKTLPCLLIPQNIIHSPDREKGLVDRFEQDDSVTDFILWISQNVNDKGRFKLDDRLLVFPYKSGLAFVYPLVFQQYAKKRKGLQATDLFQHFCELNLHTANENQQALWSLGSQTRIQFLYIDKEAFQQQVKAIKRENAHG